MSYACPPPMKMSSHICFLIILLFIPTVRCAEDQRVVALPTTPGDALQVNTPFKIALFADLHFGEDAWTEWGPQQDLNSLKVMSSVLDNERPGESDH